MHDRATAPTPYPWHLTPFVWLMIAMHLLLAVMGLAFSNIWPLWLGILIALQAIIVFLILTPRNRCISSAITRLPHNADTHHTIALTFDDGPDPVVTPQVLDILDQYQIKASFFCIGHRVQRYPHIVQQIVQRGHSVENHGFQHATLFALFSPSRMQKDMLKAQEAIFKAAGVWPRFFRPTAGFRPPWISIALARCGLHLAMWSARGFDTREPQTQRVLHRLTQSLKPGSILLLHDGHSATTPTGKAVVLAVLPQLLQTIRQKGLHCARLQDVIDVS